MTVRVCVCHREGLRPAFTFAHATHSPSNCRLLRSLGTREGVTPAGILHPAEQTMSPKEGQPSSLPGWKPRIGDVCLWCWCSTVHPLFLLLPATLSLSSASWYPPALSSEGTSEQALMTLLTTDDLCTCCGPRSPGALGERAEAAPAPHLGRPGLSFGSPGWSSASSIPLFLASLSSEVPCCANTG